MSSEILKESAIELAWSLWAELGVSGIVRNHRRVVVDPEHLVVCSPFIVASEPRLRDQIYGWCATHAYRISTSRLRGLARNLPDCPRASFSTFADALRVHAGVQWRSSPESKTGPNIPPLRVSRLAGLSIIKPCVVDSNRPALLRLRLRALCGVGARADVVCELLPRGAAWLRASDLNHEGYTKRNVARVLAELEGAGIVESHTQSNARWFRLAQPRSIRGLVKAGDLLFPPWHLIFNLILMLLNLVSRSEASDAVRRVEAHKLREKLVPLCQRLGLGMPPSTRGEPEAWSIIVNWGAIQVSALADGTSSILNDDRDDTMDEHRTTLSASSKASAHAGSPDASMPRNAADLPSRI